MIPTLPYLPPWYRLVAAPGKVVLEYGQRIVSLEGRAAELLLPSLLPLLDGTRTLDELVLILGEPARPAVESALAELAARGLVIEGPPLSPEAARPVAGTAELLTSLRPGGRLSDTAQAVAGRPVAVVGDGPAGVELGRLLRSSGVAVERADTVAAGVDLTACAPTPAELPRLSAWNAEALAAGAPWLQVLPFDGRYAALGPLFLPGDTCCYECFQLRRAANLRVDGELALLERTPAAYPTSPSLDAAIGGLAAVLALDWLVLGSHYAPGALYTLELVPVLTLGVHQVHRVPRCPACSGLVDVAPPLPWYKEIPVAGG